MANSSSSSSEPKPSAASEAESRAKILEGVDFIETEEDAEAVESAVVKIQSTFRGKKIRSKLGQKQAAPSSSAIGDQADKTSKNGPDLTHSNADRTKTNSSDNKRLEPDDEELNKKVSTMQVNDNGDAHEAQKQATNAANAAPAEEEAERAATKIQAGFKGYKTRKELESKLGQQVATPAGQEDPSCAVKAD